MLPELPKPTEATFFHCKPKAGQPCLRYDPTNPDALNTFLLAHGGRKARFDPDGKAHILAMVRGEERFVYCMPGSWIRCLGTCQFSAMTDKAFHELYELL